MTEFQTSHQVRAFLKDNGFTKISVRFRDNPFGGRGLFFVKLTDIPAGVTLIHSSGSDIETKTFGDHATTVQRIADLREALKDTNARADH